MEYREGEEVLVEFPDMDSRHGLVVKALLCQAPFSSDVYIVRVGAELLMRYAADIRRLNESHFTAQICSRVSERWQGETRMLVLESRVGRTFCVPKNVLSQNVAVFDPYTQDPIELIAFDENIAWVWLWNADERWEEWVKVER